MTEPGVAGTFELRLEAFSGPLEKLLELIEAKRLEITRVNLAEVTDAFFAYTKSLEGYVTPGFLADFLVVAAKLLLIKSKVLLPEFSLTEEEEEEVGNLEFRLKLYKEFAAGAALFRDAWSVAPKMATREFFEGREAIFYPPSGLSLEMLRVAMERILRAFAEVTREVSRVQSPLVSLEEKITEVLLRFETSVTQRFHAMTAAKSRSEIVVMFLAILHLLRERKIEARQNEGFDDIIIEKI